MRQVHSLLHGPHDVLGSVRCLVEGMGTTKAASATSFAPKIFAASSCGTLEVLNHLPDADGFLK